MRKAYRLRFNLTESSARCCNNGIRASSILSRDSEGLLKSLPTLNSRYCAICTYDFVSRSLTKTSRCEILARVCHGSSGLQIRTGALQYEQQNRNQIVSTARRLLHLFRSWQVAMAGCSSGLFYCPSSGGDYDLANRAPRGFLVFAFADVFIRD